MAKSFTTTIEAKAWKEHTCLNCGGVFSYLLVRKVRGQAPTAEQSQQRARQAASQSLTNEVDEHPCPTCGLVQPDMIGQARRKRHNLFFWLALVVFGVLLILRAAYVVQANTLTLVTLLVSAIVVAVHLLTDMKNPNRDMTTNRQLAKGRLDAGALRPGTAGRVVTPQAEHVSPPRSVIHTAALGMLLLALALVALPEVMRTTRRWPANPDTYPPVVGAGDTARIYMNESIHSVKSFWRGQPIATLKTPDGQEVPLSSTTNDKDWGHTIYAKSSEKNESSTPWVEVTLPASPDLAGKAADCDIVMDVTFPASSGSGSFAEEQRTMRRRVTLHPAPAHAGAAYNALWWQGTAGGMVLILLCGQILRLARSLQRRANPTRVLVS